MYTRPETRNTDYERLLHSSYGLPRERRRARRPHRVVTMSADTGVDVLPQPGAACPPADFVEYVVDREPVPPPPPADAGALPPPAAPPPDTAAGPRPAEPMPALPVPAEPMPAPTPAPTPEPMPAPAPPAEAVPVRPRDEAPQPLAPAAAAPPGAQAAPQSTSVSNADLAADMQAILTGAKVYDAATGTMRDRRGVAAAAAPPASTPAPPRPEPPRPTGEPTAEQSIFDRIAQSMSYANTFDLGTVELKRRFDQFQHADERRRAPARTEPSRAQALVAEQVVVPAPRGVPAEDFRAAYVQEGPWTAVPGRTAACGASSLALTLAPERSVPMYDTGEHVLTAGDLFPDQLRAGHDGSVLFSYGQVVAMADFYDSVDDLRAADPAELTRLKALIARSTAYYRDHRRDPSLDVGDEDWNTATGGRYLRLAEDNYAHFAPPSVAGLSEPTTRGDNRSTWIRYHGRAAHEMRALLQANPSATQPTSAVTTNAFGDHFLTDAFASGHLVNKEVLVNRFRARFFSGAQLSDAGQEFFAKVAQRAWHGPLADRFSELETTSYPLCAWGWCIPWRPNINSASRFAELLVQAAQAEPVRIANVAVKAAHDHLNRVGVEVTNDAGDPPWTLTGDGAMNDTSLAVMRRAVQQSVDNLTDPAVLAPTLDMVPLCERVLRHVPRPTPAGLGQLTRAIGAYTDPASQELVDAAAEILNKQLSTLIQLLLESGRLRRA